MEKKIIKVLEGESFEIPPIWMMRQAGRYLPEYKATRSKAGSFLNLCYTPELAIEVTLQPIERFGFDAAILFSDILVVPDAMGRSVRFVEGEGPRLDPMNHEDIGKLSDVNGLEKLQPVFEALKGIRSALDPNITLLGFCGAPWTVATYMIAGRGTPDQAPTRLFAYENEPAFEVLIEKLVQFSSHYLIEQLKSGADAVQIFDSWSGVLDEKGFLKWSLEPIKKIVTNVRNEIPDAKIIGFPKGASWQIHKFQADTGINAIGIDWSIPMAEAKILQRFGAVQGNLDPMKLVAGGTKLDEGVDHIINNLGKGPLIFNLGHGITPQTPIANVERMISRVRKN